MKTSSENIPFFSVNFQDRKRKIDVYRPNLLCLQDTSWYKKYHNREKQNNAQGESLQYS